MRRLAGLLAVVAACGSPRDPPHAGAERAPAERAPAELAQETKPAPPPVRPLDPQAKARLRDATKALEDRGCELDALEVVRELQRIHGDLEPLVEAQRVAFAACRDADALAELIARTMAEGASPSARLQLGAAWVRAARYEEAVAVLEPLARREGNRSEAAWLAGFALFHAGESERARPLLESARHHAGKDVGDAWLLIGLCKLHEGDLAGATTEFEAGLKVVGDDPSLWTSLSRAYAASGRSEDAARARKSARAARDARAEDLRTKMWLAARATALRVAATAQDVEEVERLFDRMWPDASPELRLQMLEVRADVYAKAGLETKANADLDQAKAMRRSGD